MGKEELARIQAFCNARVLSVGEEERNLGKEFWVGLWRGRQAIRLLKPAFAHTLLSCSAFPRLGGYHFCPGGISKPTGAENPGTEARRCYRFLIAESSLEF